MYLLEARYYQVAGRIREWIGAKQNDKEAIEVGRQDQLVGRIAEHCHISVEEAESLAIDYRLLGTERSQLA